MGTKIRTISRHTSNSEYTAYWNLVRILYNAIHNIPVTHFLHNLQTFTVKLQKSVQLTEVLAKAGKLTSLLDCYYLLNTITADWENIDLECQNDKRQQGYVATSSTHPSRDAAVTNYLLKRGFGCKRLSKRRNFNLWRTSFLSFCEALVHTQSIVWLFHLSSV